MVIEFRDGVNPRIAGWLLVRDNIKTNWVGVAEYSLSLGAWLVCDGRANWPRRVMMSVFRRTLRGARIEVCGGNGRQVGRHTSVTEVHTMSRPNILALVTTP